jgi:predicted helicase
LVPQGKGDLESTFGPEDVFHYMYAVFHSPTYRERYAEFLKIDFPRLPLTSDLGLFRALAEKGEELVGLHLMESPTLDHPIAKFPVKGSNEVEKVRYAEPAEGRPGLVYINKTQYFEGVEPEVWEFHIGGYRVLEKWLKDRKGRTLSYDDVTHYGKIVVALKETIRLMAEIDGVIPSWPIE